jgi:hypothetical protein
MVLYSLLHSAASRITSGRMKTADEPRWDNPNRREGFMRRLSYARREASSPIPWSAAIVQGGRTSPMAITRLASPTPARSPPPPASQSARNGLRESRACCHTNKKRRRKTPLIEAGVARMGAAIRIPKFRKGIEALRAAGIDVKSASSNPAPNNSTPPTRESACCPSLRHLAGPAADGVAGPRPQNAN